MDITKWNIEEAKEVWREEALEEGREDKAMEIAQNALAEGFSVEAIQKITGLDLETIKNIQARGQ